MTVSSNTRSKHLTISKKKIPFNSRSVENRITVLYSLEEKNRIVEIRIVRIITYPIKFIMILLPCMNETSNRAQNVPRDDNDKSRINTILRFIYCRFRNLSLKLELIEKKFLISDNISDNPVFKKVQ